MAFANHIQLFEAKITSKKKKRCSFRYDRMPHRFNCDRIRIEELFAGGVCTTATVDSGGCAQRRQRKGGVGNKSES